MGMCIYNVERNKCNKKMKLFYKWTFENLMIKDLSVHKYMFFDKNFGMLIPHTSGKYNKNAFYKLYCPFIERFICSLMMHGRNSGKKLKSIIILNKAFILINILTKSNPLQVLIDAIINSSPIEDITIIKKGSVGKKQAVDVSPYRRISQSIHFITCGARKNSFKAHKPIFQCLAEEIIWAAKRSSNSYSL